MKSRHSILKKRDDLTLFFFNVLRRVRKSPSTLEGSTIEIPLLDSDPISGKWKELFGVRENYRVLMNLFVTFIVYGKMMK